MDSESSIADSILNPAKDKIVKYEVVNRALREASLKALIHAIPVFGPALVEFIFETRGRIKQDRVNRFIEEFGQYMQQFQKSLTGHWHY